jgi:predicted phosphodiesterase
VRVAALYDVHGNLPALEAVLADVAHEEPDQVVVGGDVLWGAFQSECLAALRAVDALFVQGNCERDVLQARGETWEWSRARLSPEEVAFVSSWPKTVELEVDRLGRVLFCHATPRSLDENITRTTSDADLLAAALAAPGVDVVVGGHTHVQLDRVVPGAPRLVNAGSVGMPFQGEPGGFWAIIGDRDVRFRKTLYDVDAALARLARSGFPSALGVYEESLRGVARAESATAYFAARRSG